MSSRTSPSRTDSHINNSDNYHLLSFELSHEARIFLLCFFFFQAEDGIRDVAVTGVQTCALPICTLALHLAGNIRYYIGTVLGESGYVRDRDAEFALRDVPRTDLLGGIDAALVAVERGMARVRDADLSKAYPDPPRGLPVTTRDYLIHLIAHFTYHLGQVDYHRRLLTGQPGEIHAVDFGDLVTTGVDTKRA